MKHNENSKFFEIDEEARRKEYEPLTKEELIEKLLEMEEELRGDLFTASKKFDKIFPPVFSEEGIDENGNNCRYIIRGKRENLCIRRLSREEENIVDIIEKLLN